MNMNEIAYDLLDELDDKTLPLIEQWKDQFEKKIDVKELSDKLEKVELVFNDQPLFSAISNICDIKNTEEENLIDPQEIEIGSL